jgi:CDP-glucose 4,6-dehydratase
VALGSRAVESLEVTSAFWKGRRVFLTGHTGFKGSWLSLWLQSLGAELTGYALRPPTRPSLFQAARVARGMNSIVGDVREPKRLGAALARSRAQIVVHMAAQSLVRESYADPVGTYATNVMGTVNVLEAARAVRSVRAVVVVTSDKCYDNRERRRAYAESDALGGADPYSSSKACAELASAAYRRSFHAAAGVQVASARAGNVLGGGDWSKDRIVPDALRAFHAGEKLGVRNPEAVRPWQHVLDPLHGYLMLAERLCRERTYAEAWNFGPVAADHKPVRWLVDQLARRCGSHAAWRADRAPRPHEAQLLRLDCTKAVKRLRWRPRLNLHRTLDWVVEWHQRTRQGEDARAVTLEQIARFQRAPAK